MDQLGKLLMVMGVALLLMGALMWLAGRFPWLGRLPGDLYLTKGNISCIAPLATSILLSLVLTTILNILARWLYK